MTFKESYELTRLIELLSTVQLHEYHQSVYDECTTLAIKHIEMNVAHPKSDFGQVSNQDSYKHKKEILKIVKMTLNIRKKYKKTTAELDAEATKAELDAEQNSSEKQELVDRFNTKYGKGSYEASDNEEYIC